MILSTSEISLFYYNYQHLKTYSTEIRRLKSKVMRLTCMLFSEKFTGRICLSFLMCSAALAVPVPDLINEIQIHSNELGLVKRVPGGSAANAIEVNFDVTNWPTQRRKQLRYALFT